MKLQADSCLDLKLVTPSLWFHVVSNESFLPPA